MHFRNVKTCRKSHSTQPGLERCFARLTRAFLESHQCISEYTWAARTFVHRPVFSINSKRYSSLCLSHAAKSPACLARCTPGDMSTGSYAFFEYEGFLWKSARLSLSCSTNAWAYYFSLAILCCPRYCRVFLFFFLDVILVLKYWIIMVRARLGSTSTLKMDCC